MQNITEGSSRFSNKDRKNFLIIARGSAFECAGILRSLKSRKINDLRDFVLQEGDGIVDGFCKMHILSFLDW